jgi:predicted N-acetyltransferase YhbS
MARIRTMTPADTNECASICYKAFNAIAAQHNFPSDFPSVQNAHELVEALQSHPQYFSVVAESGDRVIGSNFLDERSAIFSVGPVSVASDVQDGRVGRALMQAVLDRSAERQALGVRLVQAHITTVR